MLNNTAEFKDQDPIEFRQEDPPSFQNRDDLENQVPPNVEEELTAKKKIDGFFKNN